MTPSKPPPLCRNGLHHFTAKNMYVVDGQKRCRLCRNLRSQLYKARKDAGIVLDKTLCRKQLHPKVEGQHRCYACRADHARKTYAKIYGAKVKAETKRATRWAANAMPKLGFNQEEVKAFVTGKGWRVEPLRHATPMDAELDVMRTTKGARKEN